MDRESVERLRFDRRLQRRRDWVESSEVDANLEALPDVSDKMTTAAELEAEEAEQAAAESEAAAEALEPQEAAAPVAGDFGEPTTLGGGSFGAPADGSFGGSSEGGTGGDSGGSTFG